MLIRHRSLPSAQPPPERFLTCSPCPPVPQHSFIDLQQGIVSIPALAPRTGADVAATGARLAERFRACKAPVVLVNVAFAADFGDALKSPVDRPSPRPEGGVPANFSHLVEGLAEPSDILVTKHQWGAFYGTDLDVQLRRRSVKTVVLAGIATNMGVESDDRTLRGDARVCGQCHLPVARTRGKDR
jgi:nicotinamidase-related amidase